MKSPAYPLVGTFFVWTMLLGASVFGASKLERPNVILLFADDISARELPIYGSTVWSGALKGEDTSDMQYRAKTPVLDRLAEEGCWFANTWSGTICSPARAMMMTGRFAHIHKWWDNKDKGRYIGANGKPQTWPLYESSSIHLGHVAQMAGYGTFWAGKTQMSGDLTRYGYDEGCFTPGSLSETDNPYTDFTMFTMKANGKQMIYNSDTGKPISTYLQHSWYWYPWVRLMNNGGKAGFEWWPNTPESRETFGLHTYGPDVELDFIFRFMERKHSERKPFFVYHTSHLGHDAFDWMYPESGNKWPGTPVVKWMGDGYERVEPKISGDAGEYDAHGTVTEPGIHKHINYLDYQVWLYRRKLEELGIADNTIFIFCADNGTSGYGKHNLDRQKGPHVPLFIYAPGMTKSGRQEALVSMSDFLPTLAELVGVELPAEYSVNGESLVPFLYSEKKEHRDWIYTYQGAAQLIRGRKVLRDGKGKWWDLTNDPDDLISFNRIEDWSMVSEEHRKERDLLDSILPRFDLHGVEPDAPGMGMRVSDKKNLAGEED